MKAASVKRFFSPLWKSFYSFSLYREAAEGKACRPVWFLIFLCALCAALFSVKMHLSAVAVMKEDLPFVLAQLPDIRIADGRLSTEIPALQSAVKDPLYAVRLPGGELLAVIDETADSAPEGLGGARIYVTGCDLTVSDGVGRERSYSFAPIRSLSLDRKTLEVWSVRAYYFAGLAFFPFLFAGFAVCRFVQAAALGLAAYAAFRAAGMRPAFFCCISLAVTALVPPVIAGTFMDITAGREYIGFVLTLLISAAVIAAVVLKIRAGAGNGR